jgi:hypothetical protein
MLKLSGLLNKVKIFYSLPTASKILLIEAVFYSALARLIIILIPFKRYKKFMGIHNEETPLETDFKNHKTINKVSWAVAAVCTRTPWQSKCLVQALTAQRILKKRNIGSTLYLGVNKGWHNKIEAHAWLRCGKVFVTGGYYRNDYVEVAKFSLYQ